MSGRSSPPCSSPGVLQFLLGVLRAGRFTTVVPSAVIKGMLAAIGITIVLKQLPVAFGVSGGLSDILTEWHTGAVLDRRRLAGGAVWLETDTAGPLQARSRPRWWWWSWPACSRRSFRGTVPALEGRHYVEVPLGGLGALWTAVPRPDFGALVNPGTWMAGATIAIVASIETLLSLQAVDRLDPLKRHSPPDRELLAQGAANAVSGLLGGLPLTAVIVRSGANVTAGARERLSAVVHGVLLLVAVIFAGPLLNRIPLAGLAAVLMQVGLNLCKPALFATQARLGITQLLPFAITIIAVLAMDLLKGVIVGIVAGTMFVLYENSKRAIIAVRDDTGTWRLRFRRDGTFVSKPGIVSTLDEVDDGEHVVIDGTGEYIDHDVKEVLATFIEDARHRNIKVTRRRHRPDPRAGPEGGTEVHPPHWASRRTDPIERALAAAREASCPIRAPSACSSTTTRCTPFSTNRSTMECRPAPMRSVRGRISPCTTSVRRTARDASRTWTCGTEIARLLGQRASEPDPSRADARGLVASVAGERHRHRGCGGPRVHRSDGALRRNARDRPRGIRAEAG